MRNATCQPFSKKKKAILVRSISYRLAYEAIRGQNQPGDQTLGEVQIQIASATGRIWFQEEEPTLLPQGFLQ